PLSVHETGSQPACHSFPPRRSSDLAEIRAGLREFIAYLKDLFDRKRHQPGEDMISRMVLAEDDGETLTEEETLATVFLMYLAGRSEEHTSELQSRENLVCRLLLEKK